MNHMMLATALSEPFRQPFVVRAMLVAVIAGALCGLLSVYITLRGMSYLGHGLSHSIFGGAAVSAAIGFNFFIGAAVWGLATGLAIGRVTKRRIIGSDAAIGVITTASFALGLVLKALFRRVNRSIDATLFGSILGVSRNDVFLVLGVAALTTVFVVSNYRPLLFLTFDPEVAEVSGVRNGLMDAGLMLTMSFAVLATMKVLGVTLIAATLVTPSVISRLLTNSFAPMLVLSTAIGAVGGGLGMYLSYFWDTPSGPTIVLVESAVFLAVFLGAGARGRRRLKGLATDHHGAQGTVGLAQAV